MKILYAIQATGNGHLVRARDIVPALMKKCTVDLLLSGTQADVSLAYPIKFRLKGLSFVFGKKGGVDILKTFSEASIISLIKEINTLPVEDYDFVINDFEPVSAWACQQKKVPCISLSHQSSLLSPKVPTPKKFDLVGATILKYYAPSMYKFGFHFAKYDKNIFTPIIRSEVRKAEKDDHGHYTVYLPSYSDERLVEILSLFKKVRWQVFSKHNLRTTQFENMIIHPISEELFTQSLINCRGVLCGAGFETPAEALYLGKKLMVIPMSGQLEQHYNAAALKLLGVPILKKLKPSYFDKISNWLQNDTRIEINYPDNTDTIINKLFEYYIQNVRTKTSIVNVPDG